MLARERRVQSELKEATVPNDVPVPVRDREIPGPSKTERNDNVGDGGKEPLSITEP